MRDPEPILLTGATGYVGSHLLDELLARGRRVRALVREPRPGRLPATVEQCRGDALTAAGLADALAGCRTAYYLIHSMGRGAGSGDFAARDRAAAVNFGEAARDAGVERVIYLGGLGADTSSEHLRSRGEVAELLRPRVPQFIHARAAMIIGQGSASFEMLLHLTRRLPVMITPRWLDTRTQPIAIGDVARALAALGELEQAPAEVQLGGADVLTYREMIHRTAAVLGRRTPLVIPVPLLTPRLSSHWVALVTPVETGLVRPLIDGLREEMVVGTPPPAGVNDEPLGFDDAVRRALA
jgi:uncharacterized protein YbjT (DUF2867 family)